MGLPVRPRGPDRAAFVGRAALVPGLEPALRDPERARRGGGRDGRRPGTPVPDHGEPQALAAFKLRGACRRGYFLDFVLKRELLARYGLSVDDANMMVMTAVGG